MSKYFQKIKEHKDLRQLKLMGLTTLLAFALLTFSFDPDLMPAMMTFSFLAAVFAVLALCFNILFDSFLPEYKMKPFVRKGLCLVVSVIFASSMTYSFGMKIVNNIEKSSLKSQKEFVKMMSDMKAKEAMPRAPEK